jgi:ferredoxin--NADP+ reductase/benzoate/toluate 1,2-dioxygenase reductase subunit
LIETAPPYPADFAPPYPADFAQSYPADFASPRRPPAATRAREIHRVLHLRDISSSAFVLRFSRESLSFRAGQWVNIGLPRTRHQREYSLYSSPGDSFLEILVKEIPEGTVSRALHRCRPGDTLEVDGPHGSFSLAEGTRASVRFLFVATGTGVSPFHCFARDNPGLDYLLLHGVRDAAELYDSGSFAPDRFIPCISRGHGAKSAEYRGASNAYAGRVTAYLAEQPVEPSRYCYLCGNSDMIYEAYALLRKRGVPHSRIFAEVYF